MPLTATTTNVAERHLNEVYLGRAYVYVQGCW